MELPVQGRLDPPRRVASDSLRAISTEVIIVLPSPLKQGFGEGGTDDGDRNG